MSDRGAAYLFGQFFEYLAEKGDRETALKFWRDSFEFDFSPYEMCVDDALKKLGLAKDFINEYGEKDILYADSDGVTPE